MRRLLLLPLLVACAGGAPSTDDGPPEPEPDTDTPTVHTDAPDVVSLADVMTVTAELRDALRASPDHRTARAEALIAAGDPAAILAFVRDEIGVLPPTSIDGFVPAHRQRIMGARGALRGGLGSMRDKAELLAWMMTEAGFPSRVGAGLAPPGFTLAPGPVAAPPFAPAVAAEDLARWAEVWGVAADAALDVPTFEPDVADLSAALRPLVDPSRATAPYDLEPARVAVVEITTPEGVVWGNPNHPEATLDDPKVRSGLDPDEPAEESTLRVRAWARLAGTGDAVELVEGTFPLPALVGRRVSLRMPRAADPSDLLPLRATEVPLVIPTLSVDDPHAAPEEVISVSGPMFTLFGDALEDEGALVRAGGGALVLDEDAAARAAQVRSLEVTADARRFDEVRLRLAPRGADGAVVPGLDAVSVALLEEGAPVDAVWTANARAPRVLVLLDRSTSVPDAFRGEGAAALVGEVADLTLATPGAQVGVLAVGQDEVRWRGDRDDVLADLDALPSSSSALWAGLDRALALSPGVVLYLTDAATLDAPDDAARARLAQTEARVVVLAVGDVDEDTAQAMAGPDGLVAPVDDREAALAVVEEVLADDEVVYEVVYRAPAQGPRTREVEARVGAISASTRYDVPDAPTPRRALAGLYLTVEVEGRGEVTRTLAGLPHDAPVDAATQATLAEVEAATHGVASVVVEGGTPGLAEVLADHLEARLTLAALARAEDDPARLAALDAGFLRLPLDPQWLLLGAAEDAPAGPPTVPLGPQLVLWSDMPAFAPSEGQRAVDLLVLDRWASVDPDPEAAFWQTFDRTLRLGLVEQGRYATSTASLLAGRALRRLPAPDVVDAFPDVPGWATLAAGLDDDWDLLVPEDGQVVAAWAVHAPTGAVIGLLPDQRGGGQERLPGLEDELRIYELIDKLHGAWGLSGGVWIKLEIAKAKIVGYATLAILNLDGYAVDVPQAVEPGEVAENLICSLIEDARIDALPGRLSRAIKNVALVSVLLGLPPPSVC